MTPCQFWSDSNVAANKCHCAAHGDRHPTACANELRRELDAALLKIESLKKLLRRAQDALGPDRTPTDRMETLMAIGRAFACDCGATELPVPAHRAGCASKREGPST